MTPRPEIARLVAVLRAILKRRGLRYHDVATAIGVSLPTVKRLFADGTMDMERVLAVADWLGVGFYELVGLSRAAAEDVVRFTPEEEAFFAAHPGYLAFFMALKGGARTPAAVAKAHGLSAKSERRYVQRLEAMGLLTRAGDGEVRVARRGAHFVWDDWGVLGRLYSRYFVGAMAERARRRLDQTDAPPGTLELATGSRYLTAAERDELTSDLGALADKYRRCSAMNSARDRAAAAGTPSGAATISYLFVTDAWKDDFFDAIPEL